MSAKKKPVTLEEAARVYGDLVVAKMDAEPEPEPRRSTLPNVEGEDLTPLEILNRARVFLAVAQEHSHGDTEGCLVMHAVTELDRLAEALAPDAENQGAPS